MHRHGTTLSTPILVLWKVQNECLNLIVCLHTKADSLTVEINSEFQMCVTL